MDLLAEITGIRYLPFLCRRLNEYCINDLGIALNKDATFILKTKCNNKIAISWWVSPKRTRAYPYARVYDSLAFSGKRITIIPFLKDEGKDGDRDFLQWDTVSLMSLLGIYVIISYYKSAEKSPNYKNKITNQRFDNEHLELKINEILSYQSDALHWNLNQIEDINKVAEKALNCYKRIAESLCVQLHSQQLIEKRIKKITEGKEYFKNLSRNLAKKAQIRESITIQPKEKLIGRKGTLTIKNYLGGYYFLTCDEIYLKEKNIELVEGKHSKEGLLPSLEDIKDGLIKMILFTNLKYIKFEDNLFNPISILKLTSNKMLDMNKMKSKQIEILKKLKKESEENGFELVINNKNLKDIDLDQYE